MHMWYVLSSETLVTCTTTDLLYTHTDLLYTHTHVSNPAVSIVVHSQFTCVMERLVQQDTDPATLQRARNLALRTAFREVDRDNNGALDCDELLTLLRRVTLTHVSDYTHSYYTFIVHA
jgi:EF hand